MAEVTFDYVPSYSSTSSITPKINIVQFGDGYIQRGTDGINIFREKWSLNFNSLTDEDSLAIETLLKTAAGGTILWKPPPVLEADPYKKWLCKGWTRTRNNYNHQSLQCEFEELFD